MDGRKTIKQTYQMWLSIYTNNEAHERGTQEREREEGREKGRKENN